MTGYRKKADYTRIFFQISFDFSFKKNIWLGRFQEGSVLHILAKKIDFWKDWLNSLSVCRMMKHSEIFTIFFKILERCPNIHPFHHLDFWRKKIHLNYLFNFKMSVPSVWNMLQLCFLPVIIWFLQQQKKQF